MSDMPTSLSGDQIILDLRTRTYESFRTQAIDLISVLTPEWTDVFPHDPGIVLIELFSGQSDILSYYIDRAVAESHWATAQLRQSVLNMSDLIGYSPKSAVSSTVAVDVTTTGVGGSLVGIDTIGGQPFRIATTSKNESGIFNFELLNAYSFAPAEVTANLIFVEGLTVLNEILGSSDGSRGQAFVILQTPITKVSTGSSPVLVQVHDGASWITWEEAPTDNFLESSASDKHYTIDIDAFGGGTIRFGDGVNGYIPELGSSNIRVTYRTGGGSISNNISAGSITEIKTTSSLVTSVTNTLAPSGGDTAETVAQIKNNAPRVWSTQNRAVTHKDFEALALTINGVFKVKADWYKGYPTKEAIYVAVTGDNPVPTGTWNEYKQTGTGLLGSVGDLLVSKANSAVSIVMLPVVALPIKCTIELHIKNNYLQNEVTARVLLGITAFIKTVSSTDIPDFLPLSGLMAEIEGIDGVDFVNVSTFRRQPYIEEVTVGDNDTVFGDVTVGRETKDETWTVFFTSTTTFSVEGTVSGLQVATGVVGTLYISDLGEIQFTATAGTITNKYGDTYKIVSGKEAGNITIQVNEIPILDSGSPTITTVGGIP